MVVLLGLLAYAAIAALASPILLSRGAWRIRYPSLALRLWLAAFLSGLLALLGSLSWSIGLVTATHATKAVPSEWFGPTVIVVFAWGGLGVLGGVIALAIARFEPMDAAKRRASQHLMLLEATSSYRQGEVAGIRVNYVNCAAPIAISFAGEDRRIVVSSTLEQELTPAQLRSVVEHERAHLTRHHGLIAGLSQLNLACVPKFLGAREFERSAQLLIELIADDSAARVCGVVDTANALVRVAHLHGSEAMELRAARLVENAGGRLPARRRRRVRAVGGAGRSVAARR
jgi:Zn-dependent protease with chaperone function